MDSKELNNELNKEYLCEKIQKIHYISCIEKRESISKNSYFSPASTEINRISNDIQNFCCINAINSMLKYCVN
jgi:hypothetical protein